MSNNEKKNDDGIVSGIILIVIGLIALVVTFFDVEIVWSELAKLWPVFIIIFGISILPFNKLFKSILVIAMLLISFFLYYFNTIFPTNTPSTVCTRTTYEPIDNEERSIVSCPLKFPT